MTEMTVNSKTEAAWKKDGLGVNQLGKVWLETAHAYLYQASEKWATDGSTDGINKKTWNQKFKPDLGFAFKDIDKNKNGKISQSEFIDSLSYAALASEFLVRNTELTSTDAPDLKSESLSESEWNNAGLPVKLGVTFTEADSDGDGKVNIDEFLSSVNGALETPSLKGINCHIKHHSKGMDGVDGSEKDGKVSLEEYMAWRKKRADKGGDEFINARGNAALESLVTANSSNDGKNGEASAFFQGLVDKSLLVASKHAPAVAQVEVDAVTPIADPTLSEPTVVNPTPTEITSPDTQEADTSIDDEASTGIVSD